MEVVYKNILSVRPNHEKIISLIHAFRKLLCSNALTGFIYNIK
jgi:hypothetical protein